MRQALGLVWQVAAIVPLQIHSTVGSCSLFSMTSTVDRALHPYADKQSGIQILKVPIAHLPALCIILRMGFVLWPWAIMR